MKPTQQKPLTVEQSRRALAKQVKEKDVVRLILEWSELNGYYVMVTSSITATTATKGIADLLVYHPKWLARNVRGEIIPGTGWMQVEAKRPVGGRRSIEQRILEEKGLSVVVRTLDEFIAAVSK